VDGSLLARDFWTVMQCWSVLPSVRPVVAALLDGRWPYPISEHEELQDSSTNAKLIWRLVRVVLK